MDTFELKKYHDFLIHVFEYKKFTPIKDTPWVQQLYKNFSEHIKACPSKEQLDTQIQMFFEQQAQRLQEQQSIMDGQIYKQCLWHLTQCAIDVKAAHKSNMWELVMQGAQSFPEQPQAVPSYVGGAQKTSTVLLNWGQKLNNTFAKNAHLMWWMIQSAKKNVQSIPQYLKAAWFTNDINMLLVQQSERIMQQYNIASIEDPVTQSAWVRLERLGYLQMHLEHMQKRLGVQAHQIGQGMHVQLIDQFKERQYFERSASVHLNVYQDSALGSKLRAVLMQEQSPSYLQLSFDPSSASAGFDLSHEWFHVLDHKMYQYMLQKLPQGFNNVPFDGNGTPDQGDLEKHIVQCRAGIQQFSIHDPDQYEWVQEHFPQVYASIDQWCEKNGEQQQRWMQRLLRPDHEHYIHGKGVEALFYSQMPDYLRALDPQIEKKFLSFWSRIQDGTIERLYQQSAINRQQAEQLTQAARVHVALFLEQQGQLLTPESKGYKIQQRLMGQWSHAFVGSILYSQRVTEHAKKEHTMPEYKGYEQHLKQWEEQLMVAPTQMHTQQWYESCIHWCKQHKKTIEALKAQMHTMQLPVLPESSYVKKTLQLVRQEGAYWSLPTEMCARAASDPMPWLAHYQTDPYPRVSEKKHLALCQLVQHWCDRLEQLPSSNLDGSFERGTNQKRLNKKGPINWGLRLALWHQNNSQKQELFRSKIKFKG